LRKLVERPAPAVPRRLRHLGSLPRRPIRTSLRRLRLEGGTRVISRWIVANLVAEEPEAAISFPPPPRTVRRRSGWISIILVRLFASMFLLVWLLILGSLVIDAATRAFGRPVTA